MEKNDVAGKVLAHMLEKDLFSKWMGIEALTIRPGYSRISMLIREEMVNGFGILHGGITFSLSDSAFALACNSRNNLSLALDTAINFLKPGYVGDVLTAEAKEIHNGKSTGLYQITVTNQLDHLIAVFKGTCFRTDRKLIDPI